MRSIFLIKKTRRGISMIEIMVVLGVIILLAGVLLPILAKARVGAKKIQCTSQLHQIHLALTMYDMEHDRDMENYPDRITHLVALGYVGNPKIFICPMDDTRATKNSAGATSLKPYFNITTPADNKSDWAERLGVTSLGFPEYNCSYLYEFSTRDCEGYDTDIDTWSGSPCMWPEEVLVEWDDNGDPWFLPYPSQLDRDLNGMVTWQEAKFWQLNNADVYVTGVSSPGDPGIPNSWSSEPYDQIVFNSTVSPMRSYPRSWLPMLRCFWHITPQLVDDEKNEEVLNLAVDGNAFYSSPGWEQTAWKYGHSAAPIDP